MQNELNIAVIGMGNIGTAIANMMAESGVKVKGWDFLKEVVDEINAQQSNSRYLPDMELSEKLEATSNLEEAFDNKDIVFITIPSSHIPRVLNPCRHRLKDNCLLVSLVKGVDAETGMTASEMIQDIYPRNEVLVLSGPTIATEFVKDLPCGVVIAGKNQKSLYKVASAIETQAFRARFSSDAIGVEWAGILKNLYVIGIGIIDGMEMDSINFKSAFLTKALEEMVALVTALGGKSESVYYLAGLGDLLATTLSPHSYNKRLGQLLAEGYSLDRAQEEMGTLPEGMNALRNAVYLSEKLHVPMPVAHGILSVTEGDIEPMYLIKNFMKIAI
ncbi:MAG: hypothetical protein DKM50_10285 [Candidatus Margulisiibacteriota bacterium]|nr:MAG: hypothetical protein A2X43_06330 [Candidatus Margulisbacteria bacterium GWD2_39_127]OGI05233.1 MAG: hypothetical protein A2X42_02880 [Candidatus Margulisbacteria bacterium GWF2_38_17]OGI06282.1 MAG: hypothetical protein A2X41_08460 [Candidatus Margulisbacteria bacterium GWE2_39_32]PZM78939.1 MAG: hypothetical protein DKM50_10285 [Candidatus Margulisiibacteriota bacterium]HAR64321.1 hypothetical protein [Candidatus Margulisiibacteriota bacterium]